MTTINTFIEPEFGSNIKSYRNLFFIKDGDAPIPESEFSMFSDASMAAYESFLMQKSARPIYDAYACFQPFNESTKSLFPFLKKLKSIVKPGEFILNLWDRTGWLTSLLSGFFPDQNIITTWEGNKDVLGYKGYAYWYSGNKNVSIFFCNPHKPLPFKANSFAFSIGYDLLHRFDNEMLYSNLNKMVKKDGAIIFPHVHLSNSEPKLFFERGGLKKHGREHQLAMDQFFLGTNRKGFVFSEPELFYQNDILQSQNITIETNTDSTDYNGLVAILPKDWENSFLSAFSCEDIREPENAFVIVNPIPVIDLSKQIITINKNHLSGAVEHLLFRHPVYEERIKDANGYKLSEAQSKIIYLANQGFTLKMIADYLHAEVSLVLQDILALEKIGVLQLLPLPQQSFLLQHYLMTQQFLIPYQEQTIPHIFKKAVERNPKNIALYSLQDGSEFTYETCGTLVKHIVQALLQHRISKGDYVACSSEINAEAILLFWACAACGAVFVPMAPHSTIQNLTEIKNIINPKIIFLQTEYSELFNEVFKETEKIFFDNEGLDEGDDSKIYFSQWMGDSDSEIPCHSEVLPDDFATVLFTSGSTGKPKGVPLTHGQLVRSAKIISECFQWKSSDKFFAIGGLEYMSGLRNSAISLLMAGSSTVIPQPRQNNLFSFCEQIENSGANVLGANPAFLRQILIHFARIKNQLASVNKILSTGNHLSQEIRTEIKSSIGIEILNYYGLTETTGICISQRTSDEVKLNHSVGCPVGCIAQIIDENGNISEDEKKGDLRIFGLNNTSWYLTENGERVPAQFNGWFYTKDLALRHINGEIELVGRNRNIIKSANEEIIYLDEIKKNLLSLDFVSDAIVLPFTENDAEKIEAHIILKDSTNKNENKVKQLIYTQMKKSMSGRGSISKIYFVTQFPYSVSGKLNLNNFTPNT